MANTFLSLMHLFRIYAGSVSELTKDWVCLQLEEAAFSKTPFD